MKQANVLMVFYIVASQAKYIYIFHICKIMSSLVFTRRCISMSQWDHSALRGPACQIS